MWKEAQVIKNINKSLEKVCDKYREKLMTSLTSWTVNFLEVLSSMSWSIYNESKSAEKSTDCLSQSFFITTIILIKISAKVVKTQR